MDENISIIERIPTVKEFYELYESVGWAKLDNEATEIGLKRSLYSVCALHKNKIIGCGRVIGDGGNYFYIQDIIIKPEFQRKGIGKRIMEKIMDYLNITAHKNAFVGLLAVKGSFEFYANFGFLVRPLESPAMFMRWKQ